ncbi:amidohydrolase family protein [Streptomyces sp. KL116D]|uniref:amidohydrolase family protein n=1 Tax=Streptomyces sp. KL116D TaxID=3045152 RepID=UPI003556C53B
MWRVCAELRRAGQPPRGLGVPAARRRTGGPRRLHGRDDVVLAPRPVAPRLRRRLPQHPDLKLVLTEQGSGWIPGVLDMLDYYHGRLVAAATKATASTAQTAESKFGAGLAESMGKGPSTVWRENCYVGASFMRPHEVPLRDRIGLDKIMWGSDYPHDEGTYPYTREGLRIAYAGLPREEIAAMVGGNTARVYGFDLDLLDPIAARVGPTVAELDEPLKEPPADATSPVFATGGSVRVW